jgi:ABC-type lipoprotein export system ATPase subunit
VTGVAVRCERLGKVYATEADEVVALRSVDLEVAAGARLAVLGPSGSGKSTLLTLLAGLQRPTSGRLYVGDHELSSSTERELLGLRGQVIATVVQNPGRNLIPYGSAEENIRFAQRAVPRSRRRDLPGPEELLSGLGLAGLGGRPVAGLSGGEQQRVSIAVGLACRPGLLLLDEPTSQLDARNRDHVVDLLARMASDVGSTMVAVTHDADVSQALGRSIVLSDGALLPGAA